MMDFYKASLPLMWLVSSLVSWLFTPSVDTSSLRTRQLYWPRRNGSLKAYRQPCSNSTSCAPGLSCVGYTNYKDTNNKDTNNKDTNNKDTNNKDTSDGHNGDVATRHATGLCVCDRGLVYRYNNTAGILARHQCLPRTPTLTADHAHPATGDDVTLTCYTTTQEVDGYLWWVNGRLDEATGTSGTVSIRSATQEASQGGLLDDVTQGGLLDGGTTSTYSCVAVKDGRSSDPSPEYRLEISTGTLAAHESLLDYPPAAPEEDSYITRPQPTGQPSNHAATPKSNNHANQNSLLCAADLVREMRTTVLYAAIAPLIAVLGCAVTLAAYRFGRAQKTSRHHCHCHCKPVPV